MSHRKITATTRDRECRPLCKVCKDAGKSEQVFTSHFTKNRDGKVTCPTLLAVKCRRCQNTGHTVSYCTARVREEKTKEPVKEEEPKAAILFCPRVNESASLALKAMLSPKSEPTPKMRRTIYVNNWADMEDSDDETEYVLLRRKK